MREGSPFEMSMDQTKLTDKGLRQQGEAQKMHVN